MSDLTVVYYSASRENPGFESGIAKILSESASGHEIVSVTQRPLNLGRNICVGLVEQCPENALKQLMIGLESSESEFVALAESDCLFGPEWFSKRPADFGRWCYPCPGYIIWFGRSRFWPKNMRELIGITHRQHAIDVVGKLIQDGPLHISNKIRDLTYGQTESLSQPVVTIKTRQQMHTKSPHGSEFKVELPYWGTAERIWGVLK